MTPQYLRMQAFGSYLHRTEIDFTKLGTHPLFLITGATGGGKTTILDAICCALYCQSTGGRRSWTAMRSLAAGPEDETVVDFRFAYEGKEYRFFRSLALHVKRSGARELRGTHECWRRARGESWELLCAGAETRVREVAEHLLGLTCAQFSQVVVLPQGDFLKLLLATSREKAALLTTLFDTQRWAARTQRLNQQAASLHRAADENVASCASILQRENVQDAQALAQKCADLEASCTALAEKRDKAARALADANAAYDRAADAAGAYDRMQKAAAAWRTAKTAADGAAQKRADAEKALPQAEEARAQAAEKRVKAAALAAGLEAARRQVQLSKDVQAQRAAIVRQEQSLAKAQAAANEAKARCEKGRAYIEAQEQIAAKLPALSAAVERAVRENAAAAVAADLAPGVPCPVCGSIHHPNPAKPAQALEQARARAVEAEKAAQSLPKARARLRQREQELEQARSAAEAARAALADEQGKLAAAEAAAREAAAQTAGRTLDALQTEVDGLQRAAKALERTEQSLRQAASTAQQAASAAAAALQSASSTHQEAQEQYTRAMERYRAAGPAPLPEIQRPDDRAAKAARDAAQKAAGQAAAEAGRLEESLHSALQSRAQLAKLEEEGAAVRTQCAQAERLSKLLSGHNARKVPIEQFVLGIMLDDILASANLFFTDLSGGRYRLLRRMAPAAGNAMAGLELSVLDAAAGGERAVGTLSGGELFLASLSLAFGLSDVVQAYSGAVRLDALFIDEGFGSLDQETLDTAMGALLRLQRAGRTVGIISHVSELKAVIQKQIVVSALPDGSSRAEVRV